MIWVWIYLLIACVTAVYVAWEATDEETIKEVKDEVDYELSNKALAFGQMTAIILLAAFWPLFIVGTVWVAMRDRKK